MISSPELQGSGGAVCRLTLSLNGDVGQGVLIWGLDDFRRHSWRYPQWFTDPRNSLIVWLQSKATSSQVASDTTVGSKPSPAQTATTRSFGDTDRTGSWLVPASRARVGTAHMLIYIAQPGWIALDQRHLRVPTRSEFDIATGWTIMGRTGGESIAPDDCQTIGCIPDVPREMPRRKPGSTVCSAGKKRGCLVSSNTNEARCW
ncbi:hypothetical protein V494_02744 [Pseudogymnoascus sp. VKM F-4513 (FW-928)]|nr:hypothetical protein V494_02744 [Pseudogymnoascus sp. VKM F-4513 (FW-928)]